MSNKLLPLKNHERLHMLPETNQKNIESLTSILPLFFSSTRSDDYKFVEDFVNDRIGKGEDWEYMNKLFDFNADGRWWIPVEMVEGLDDAYAYYKNKALYAYKEIINMYEDCYDCCRLGRVSKYFTYRDYENGHKYCMEEQRKYIKEHEQYHKLDLKVPLEELLDYKVFSSNRLRSGQKLTSYLLKNKIIPASAADIVNSKRMKKDERLYLCVSRNPVDYLLCSTNQSWGSCLNLESDYSSAFYMNLPGIFHDPNRVLIFLTTGKLRTYETQGVTFKHFGMLSRTWGLLPNKDINYYGGSGDNNGSEELAIVNYYPSKQVDFQKLLPPNGGVKLFDPKSHTFSEGMFQFRTIRNGENSTPMMIYLDVIGADLVQDRWEYGWYNKTGTFIKHAWDSGFGSIQSFAEVVEKRNCCESCEEYFNDDDFNHDENICNHCLDEYYSYCDDCGEYHYSYGGEGGSYVHYNFVCSGCLEDTYHWCDHCGEYDRQDVVSIDDGEEYWCEYCAENNATYCESCNSYFSNTNDGEYDEDSGQFMCSDCLKEEKRRKKEAVVVTSVTNSTNNTNNNEEAQLNV